MFQTAKLAKVPWKSPFHDMKATTLLVQLPPLPASHHRWRRQLQRCREFHGGQALTRLAAERDAQLQADSARRAEVEELQGRCCGEVRRGRRSEAWWLAKLQLPAPLRCQPQHCTVTHVMSWLSALLRVA